jgi:hypothetical protein
MPGMLIRKIVSWPGTRASRLAKSIADRQPGHAGWQSRFPAGKVISSLPKSFPNRQIHFLISKSVCRLGNDFAGWETTLAMRKRLCRLGNDFVDWETTLPTGKRFCQSGSVASRLAKSFPDSQLRHPDWQHFFQKQPVGFQQDTTFASKIFIFHFRFLLFYRF